MKMSKKSNKENASQASPSPTSSWNQTTSNQPVQNKNKK